jgi:hypothetical protein
MKNCLQEYTYNKYLICGNIYKVYDKLNKTIYAVELTNHSIKQAYGPRNSKIPELVFKDIEKLLTGQQNKSHQSKVS